MERETLPECAVVRRPGQGEPVTGELRREHWIVPVHGLTPADPDGIVQAIVRRDGTVILRLTCGDCEAMVRVGVSRAVQLSTGIREAAGAAQQLTGYLGDDQSPPQSPPASRDQLVAWRSHPHRSAPSPDLSPRRRPRPSRMNKGTAIDDETRTIGLCIQRIRHARHKSLRVIAGLAGMSKDTLHRIEHGQRELTLSEILALAGALEIAPAELVRLPISAPADRSTDPTRAAAHPHTS